MWTWIASIGVATKPNSGDTSMDATGFSLQARKSVCSA